MTGLQLKKKLRALTRTDVEQQSLITGGRHIRNDISLIDQEIECGSVVLKLSSFIFFLY
jgi:hypothetical protein